MERGRWEFKPWTKNHGWLEKPGEETVGDRLADRVDPEVPDAAANRPVFAPSGPLRPPGYDVGIPALVMLGSVLLFFWAPLVNAFVGGCLGGWRAGTLRRALLATGLALLAGLPLLFFARFMGAGFNPLFGLGWVGYLVVTGLSLLLGAWTGAACRWAIREEHGPVRRWAEGPWAAPRRDDWVEG